MSTGDPPDDHGTEEMPVYRNDLLYEIQTRARLYGRAQSRRVVQAVVQALGEFLPEAVFVDLIAGLPEDIDVPHPAGRHPDAAPPGGVDACRRLTERVATRLLVDAPNATFFCRVVFEQLNTSWRGTTPERLASCLPIDLHPLLTAHAHDPALRYRQLMAGLNFAGAGIRRREPHPLRDSAANVVVVEESAVGHRSPIAGRGTGEVHQSSSPGMIDGSMTDSIPNSSVLES